MENEIIATYYYNHKTFDIYGCWDEETPENAGPVADAGSDTTIYRNNNVVFDGTGSTDDKGIVSYLWEFEDGSTTTGATPTRYYSVLGSHTVTLTVEDLEEYYEENKENYKQEASRDIQYVEFKVLPSEEDKKNAEKFASQVKF